MICYHKGHKVYDSLSNEVTGCSSATGMHICTVAKDIYSGDYLTVNQLTD